MQQQSMMRPRKFGFYWVRIDSEWLVAEYQDNDGEVWCWCIPGEMSLVEESRLAEIDERQVVRSEPA